MVNECDSECEGSRRDRHSCMQLEDFIHTESRFHSFLSLESVSFHTSSLDNICFTIGVCFSGKHMFRSS